MKAMAQFIEENRAELVAAIVRYCPNVRQPLDDEDLEQWIMNDEGLYNWARSERVDVDGDEEDEPAERCLFGASLGNQCEQMAEQGEAFCFDHLTKEDENQCK